MGVQELEAAVLELDTEQLAEFEKRFSGFRNMKWDVEFAEDALSGRPDALANTAIASFGQGLNRPL